MRRFGNPFYRALGAATLFLSSVAVTAVNAATGPSDFDAVAVPCGAFQRWGNGGWTATAPVTLHIDNGMAIGLLPGQSMAPGSTIAGVAVPVILDRQCGNS